MPTQPEIRVEELQEGERRTVPADLPGIDSDKASPVTQGELPVE